MLFLFYKNANIKYLTSHFQPPSKKKNSCMRSMPMFVWQLYQLYNMAFAKLSKYAMVC